MTFLTADDGVTEVETEGARRTREREEDRALVLAEVKRMVSPKERSTSPVPTSESSSWTDVIDSRTAFARKVAHITPIKEAEGFGERLPGVQPRRSVHGCPRS